MQTVYTAQILDHITGEIKESKFIKKSVKDVDEFLILYIKHIALIARLPHYQLQTLLCLAPCIEWNTGEFTLDTRTMDKIISCSGIKEQSIRNSVSALKKRNILQRIKSNWYKLNPDIFWKGSELERQKSFEVTYQWDILNDSTL